LSWIKVKFFLSIHKLSRIPITHCFILIYLFFLPYLPFAVSAQILKASLDTMERHIQRLENDIQNFPKTDDKQDKFVEKMSISFECIYYFYSLL